MSVRVVAAAVFSLVTYAAASDFNSAAGAGEISPTDVLIARVRKQGFICNKPANAEKEASKPDEAVWILKCEGAAYRVRLVPSRAAHIEKIH